MSTTATTAAAPRTHTKTCPLCEAMCGLMMPGVVSLPHGWGHDKPGTRLAVAAHHAGVNNNLLAPLDRFDPISNNAAVNGIPVQIESAHAGRGVE